jgi:hypothetical protein
VGLKNLSCEFNRATFGVTSTSALRYVRIAAVFAAAALGMTYSTEETVQPYPVDPDDTPSISALKQDIARTPTGRALLEHVTRNNVKIVEADTLDGNGAYDPRTNTLILRKDLGTEDKINTFGHELRHAWQNDVLKYGEMGGRFLSPRDQWVLCQFVEADAFAFSIKLSAERMSLVRSPVALSDDKKDVQAQAKILSGKWGWHGLSDADYYQHALEPAFAFLGARRYIEKHLEDSGRYANYYYEHAMNLDAMVDYIPIEKNLPDVLREKEAMAKVFGSTPDPLAFTKWLRGFGGQSLAAGAPTVLESMDEKKLREFLPDLAVPEDRKVEVRDSLGMSDEMYQEAKNMFRSAELKLSKGPQR